MNLFDKNLAALANKHATARHLANHLKKVNTTHCQIRQTSSGELTLGIHTSQLDFDAEHALDPRGFARKHLPQVARAKNLFVFLGMGLGYGILELKKRFPDSRYLVIEHDLAIFKTALSCQDFSELLRDPNVEFAAGLEEKSLSHFLRLYFHDRDVSDFLLSVVWVPHPLLTGLSKNDYDLARRVFEREVHFFSEVAVGNSLQDQLIGFQECLKYTRYFPSMHSIEPYRKMYADRVGVVVASGPSLDSKLDHLKSIQDKAVIICADSALKKLLGHGITPFGTTCIERSENNYKFFMGYEIPKTLNLFAPPVIRHNLLKFYPGPVFLIFRQAFPFSWLPPILPQWYFGASCVHLAYKVLTFLGCKTIALVGQDLAYNRHTGSSHFNGVPEACTNQFMSETYARIPVPDNQGGTIPTNENWLIFRNIFEDFLREDQHVQCLNVIEPDFGLKISGTRLTNPQELLKICKMATPLTPLDPQKGKAELGLRLEEFVQKWPELLQTTQRDFEWLKNQLPQIKSAKNFAAYKARLTELYPQISESSLKLFREFFKPMLRRFDVNANCVWSDVEFREKLPAVLDEIVRYVGECVTAMQGE